MKYFLQLSNISCHFQDFVKFLSLELLLSDILFLKPNPLPFLVPHGDNEGEIDKKNVEGSGFTCLLIIVEFDMSFECGNKKIDDLFPRPNETERHFKKVSRPRLRRDKLLRFDEVQYESKSIVPKVSGSR